jgi:hypothetical protein
MLLTLLVLFQMVRTIVDRGLRDLGRVKAPENSLTGSLGRDVLFTRLRPSVYALKVCASVRLMVCGQHHLVLLLPPAPLLLSASPPALCPPGCVHLKRASVLFLFVCVIVFLLPPLAHCAVNCELPRAHASRGQANCD